MCFKKWVYILYFPTKVKKYFVIKEFLHTFAFEKYELGNMKRGKIIDIWVSIVISFVVVVVFMLLTWLVGWLVGLLGRWYLLVGLIIFCWLVWFVYRGISEGIDSEDSEDIDKDIS